MEPLVPPTYRNLGTQTLLMMLFKRSTPLLLFLPGLVFLFFLVNYVPIGYINVWSDVVIGYVLVFALVIVIVVAFGCLEYARYGISMGEKSLRVRRGLISVEELGLPYRRIKDVNIRRSLIDQIFGMSDVVITVLDMDDTNNTKNHESTMILPSLRERMALEIQDTILRRAQVEEINVLGG